MMPNSNWPWPNFPRRELECKCGCGRSAMNHDYMNRIQRARTLVGFAVPLTSAYRCPNHDRVVGGTGSGPHTLGRATDVNLWGIQLLIWILALMVVGIFRLPNWKGRKGWGGIGLMQKSGSPRRKRFIHADNLRPDERHGRPGIWTY